MFPRHRYRPLLRWEDPRPRLHQFPLRMNHDSEMEDQDRLLDMYVEIDCLIGNRH